MDANRVIDRLCAAFDRAGLDAVRPAGGEAAAVVDKISAAIFPWRLPEALRAFWLRVDPHSLAVAPAPRPCSPQFALEAWQLQRREGERQPPAVLFPAGYEGHQFLFVELDDDRGRGGTCFEWRYGGSPFRLRYASFASYLDLLTMMLEMGEVESHETSGRKWHRFDPRERWADLLSLRLSEAGAHPVYGRLRHVPEEPHNWPDHWRPDVSFPTQRTPTKWREPVGA